MDDMLAEAIDVCRRYEPEGGYYGLFSGGKDSVAVKEVARLAGVKVRWHYNVTTIDPPELVRFIREYHADVQWHRSPTGVPLPLYMVRAGFPSRRQKWCCKHYKHGINPHGVTRLSGLRAEESPRRAKRWSHYTDIDGGAPMVSPILQWDSEYLWEFLRDSGAPVCSLYDEGWHRLGCVGCPAATQANRDREWKRWPGRAKIWQRGFRLMWEARSGKPNRMGKVWVGDRYFRSWLEMWEWWRDDANSMPQPLYASERDEHGNLVPLCSD